TAIELIHQNSGDLQLHPIGLHPSIGLRRLGPGLPEALSDGSTHRESLRKRSARLSLRAQLDFVVMLVAPYGVLLGSWSPTAHQEPPPPPRLSSVQKRRPVPCCWPRSSCKPNRPRLEWCVLHRPPGGR